MPSACRPFVSLLAGVVALAVAAPAAAQAPRVPPIFDQLASPFTETEIGGFGCLVASTAVGAGMLALMGGPGALKTALQGVVSPRTVLEASAASAFVFSSACYVGQAAAPVVMLGFTTLLDRFTAPTRPPVSVPSGTGSGAMTWMPEIRQGGYAPLP